MDGRLVASRASHFVTTCGGHHLGEQMHGVALPANAKAAIEKNVNEFHLERMNSSGKVNSLVYWEEASRRYPIVAQVACQWFCRQLVVRPHQGASAKGAT